MTPHLIYSGKVRHRRYVQKKHEFTYSSWMFFFDIDTIQECFSKISFVSQEKFNWYSFCRHHYFTHSSGLLSDAVRDLIAKKTCTRPPGKIYLLTQLACLGYAFNPISIYFVMNPDCEGLDHLVLEVTNTPWSDRKLYVLDNPIEKNGGIKKYKFKKEMHVSPFMAMNYDYELNLKFNEKKIIIHINSYQEGKKHFDATLSLDAYCKKLNLLTFFRLSPFVTFKVTLGIYWQAFKLWSKGVTFYSHPNIRRK